jgi:hypothetical protein
MATNDKLASWKGIANYLGKGVRTVQRWEQELGLPVHRLPGKKKDIVYAFPDEIDDWLRTNSVRVQQQARAGQNDNQDKSARNWRAWLVVAGALAALALAAAGGWYRWAHAAGRPASFELKGNRLVVYDQSRRRLWTHEFDAPLNEAYYRNPSSIGSEANRQLAALDDLDQDGKTEMFLLAAPDGDGEAWKNTLVCFDSSGRIRWQYHPAHTVRFGDDLYEPPFVLEFFLLGNRGADGSRAVWAVSHHNTWFPTVVAKLNPQGEVLAEYWHAGVIGALAEAHVGGRHVILAGGTNNEQFSGAVSILDYDNPQGSAPAASHKYRCRSCPPGGPLGYILLPRPELSRALDSRPFANRIWVRGSSEVEIGAVVGPDATGLRGGMAFFFDPDFHLQNAEVSDTYVTLHHQLEARGALKHPMDRRRESEALKRIRYWDGEKFTNQWVPLGTGGR